MDTIKENKSAALESSHCAVVRPIGKSAIIRPVGTQLSNYAATKHMKHCGFAHTWDVCPYNPLRVKRTLLVCPSCNETTFVLRDYGKCKYCIHGNGRRQQGRDKKWHSQSPPTINLDREEGEVDVIEQVAVASEEATWNPLKKAYRHVRNDVEKRSEPALSFMRDRINTVTEKVSDVAVEITAVSTKVQKVIENLTQFVADIPSHLPGADTIMSFVVNLISFLKISFSSSEITVKIAGFALFIGNYVKIGSVIEWASKEVLSLLPKLGDFIAYLSGGWRSQGIADEALKVTTTLVAIMVGCLLRKVPGKTDFDSILRRIDLFPKAIRGAGDIIKYVQTAIKTAVSVCCDALGHPSPFDNGLVTEADQWVALANDLLTRKLTELTYTSKYADEVANCHVQGNKLIKNLNTMKAETDVIRYIGQLQSQITAMNNKLAHLGFAAGPRSEPLMVYLHGSSGKGKSGLTVPFFIELAKHDPDFNPKEWEKLIYMRCAETEYWDGARNDQPFLCYDDFGQQRDSAANPNPELFEIIRLANIVPYPAHMASLEEKGKTFLHPRCVLLTSNSREPRIESLTFPDAFHRRMDIVAEVDILPQYTRTVTTQVGTLVKLDVTKCSSQFDPRVYVFRVKDKHDMDYKQFMSYVKEQYDIRMARGEKLLRELNNYTAHSLESIYASLADGTFDDMVIETAKVWKAQTGGGDPYVPRTGRSKEEIHAEISKRCWQWYEGDLAPTQALYEVFMSLQREARRLNYDEVLKEEEDAANALQIHRSKDEELTRVLTQVAAGMASFTDGIDESTVTGQLFVQFLRGRLPAQLDNERCNDADRSILQYFVAQRDALMLPVVYPSVMEKDILNSWETENSPMKNRSPLLKKFLAKSAGLGNCWAAISNPMQFVYKLWSQNWNQKSLPPSFTLPACARALKGMYYGTFFVDLKTDDVCRDLVDVYVKRGAAHFMDTYKPINRKAAIRISRVFNQVTADCSTNGCTNDLEACFRTGLSTALESGIVIPHDIVELNQTPVFLAEEETEMLECFRGDTFWEKMRYSWFDLSFKFTEWFGNYPKVMFLIMLLGSVVAWQMLQQIINVCCMLINVAGTALGFVEKPKVWETSNIPESVFLKTGLPAFFNAKIAPEDCVYCQTGKYFGEGVLQDAANKFDHFFTQKGFINRFDYYVIRRLIFDAKKQPISLFELYRKRIDSVNGPGCFHYMLHGGLDKHPYFQDGTYADGKVQEHEREYNNLFKELVEQKKMSCSDAVDYMLTESTDNTKNLKNRKMNSKIAKTIKGMTQDFAESFDMKDARKQQVRIETSMADPESFDMKDARRQQVRIETSMADPESFDMKDARARQVRIESHRDVDMRNESFDMKDARKQQVRVETNEAEGSAAVSAYFSAMKTIYNDAQVAPEGLLDNNAWEIISKRVFKNQFILTTPEGAEIAKGMFVQGNCAIIYKHWKTNCPIDDVQCRFLDNRPYFSFSLKTVQFQDFETTRGENEDLLLMIFPRHCPQYPSVLNSFVSEVDLPRMEGRKAQLCGIRDVYDGDFVSYNLQGLTLKCQDCSYSDQNGVVYQCRKGYEYEAETKAGDCGSILVMKDSTFAQKIVGMHVAGRAGYGYSMCLYREKIERALKKVDWEAQCYPPLELISCVDAEVPEGAFMPVGKLPMSGPSFMNSCLRPSSIAGCCMETEKKPAKMFPFMKQMEDGSEIMWNPLMEGLKKCGKVLVPLPEEMMREVAEDVARVYSNATPYSRERRVYSLNEAVFGREGDEYFGSLEVSTSPGFPWNFDKLPRKGGKSTWVDLIENRLSDDIKYHVEKRIEFALAGRRYPTLWQDLLKDETRPIEKVDEGKTRVFSGSPIDFTIVCRMYFGAFIGAQAAGRIYNESLVGTNCYGEDWNLAAKTLLTHGDNVVAGDYSNWDGSVSAQLLYAALDVMNTWYGDDEEGNKIRTVLMMDIANSLHVIGNNVYMWTHSMPSGVCLTATVNTIIGQMLMRVFYLKCAPKSLANMADFERNVKIEIYGDDNVVNPSQRVLSFFNQRAITDAATSIGMTYTDEQKHKDQKAIPLYRNLKDVTLLKRHFEYSQEEGRWIGPLQLRTVLDIPNWYRSGKAMPEEVVMPLIVECVLRELSLYPKDVYYSNKQKITDALVRSRKRVPAMSSYEPLRFAMLNGYKSYFGQSD